MCVDDLNRGCSALATCFATVLLGVVCGCADTSHALRLQTERPAIIRVGQLAMIQLRSEEQFSGHAGARFHLCSNVNAESTRSLFIGPFALGAKHS